MHYPFIPIKPEKYWIKPNKPKSYYYKDIPLIRFCTITSKPIEYIIQKLAKIQKDNAGEELICANSCIQYKKDLVTYEKYTIQKQMDELTEKAAKLGLKIAKK